MNVTIDTLHIDEAPCPGCQLGPLYVVAWGVVGCLCCGGQWDWERFSQPYLAEAIHLGEES